jgi:hypothetical protein
MSFATERPVCGTYAQTNSKAHQPTGMLTEASNPMNFLRPQSHFLCLHCSSTRKYSIGVHLYRTGQTLENMRLLRQNLKFWYPNGIHYGKILLYNML